MDSGFRLNKIFHPSDFSEGDEVAFLHALKIALEAGANYSILHVTPNSYEVSWADFPKVRATLRQWSVAAGMEPDALENRSNLKVTKEKVTGSNPIRNILEHIQDMDPDLVVLATHQRHGFDRWVHNATAEPVARSIDTMTLFVPRHHSGFVSASSGRAVLKNILIPIDWSPPPQRTVDSVLTVCRVLKCEDAAIHLLHVNQDDEMPSVNLPEGAGHEFVRINAKGGVVESILENLETIQPDLVAMGTHGRDGFLDCLRGSTTERVLRIANCPVLAIPAKNKSIFGVKVSPAIQW